MMMAYLSLDHSTANERSYISMAKNKFQPSIDAINKGSSYSRTCQKNFLPNMFSIVPSLLDEQFHYWHLSMFDFV